LLPKSLFAFPKTFFNKSKARFMRFQNSPTKANQQAEIANLSLRQDFLATSVFMAAQRNSCSGNSLLRPLGVTWFVPQSFKLAVPPAHGRQRGRLGLDQGSFGMADQFSWPLPWPMNLPEESWY
jgi:hypothetical protein